MLIMAKTQGSERVMPESEKKPPIIEPPEDLLCRRNDGKSWRCRHWRIHDNSYCQNHYLANQNKSPRSSTSSASSFCAERHCE
ncbi:hypothetical protein ACSQ67_011446 [Phaseolus vulgaris]